MAEEEDIRGYKLITILQVGDSSYYSLYIDTLVDYLIV